MLNNPVVDSLEPVDLSPGRFPGPKVRCQPIDRFAQGLQPLRRRRMDGHVVIDRVVILLGQGRDLRPQRLTPEHRQRRRDRVRRPPIVPGAQHIDGFRELQFQGIAGVGRVVGLDQSRYQPRKGGQVGIIGGVDQRLEGEILAGAQDTDRMGCAGVFSGLVHVSREICGLERARARGGPGRVVAVVDPSARRVDDVRGLFEGDEPVPICRRVRSIDRLGVVEAIVALGHELRQQEGGFALRIGEQGVVRRIGGQAGDLQERRQVSCLGAAERLFQRFDRLEHEGHCDPLVPVGADDRAMVRVEDRESRRLAAVSLVGNGNRRDGHRPQLCAIFVEQLAVLPDDGFGELVDRVGAGRGVHPSRVGVEALIDKELTPGRGAIGVQSLIARHLQLGAEVEGRVRIDQQQGMAIPGAGGADSDSI